MGLEVISNIQSLVSRLQQRGQGLRDYTIVASNSMQYAAAVDQGYTQKVTRKQEIAIIIAIKNRPGPPKSSVWEGEPGYSKKKLEEDGYAYEITIPPAGIIAKSIKPIEEHVKSVLARLPVGQEAAEQIAKGIENILVSNTPVDQGPLHQSWVVSIQ